MASYKDISKMTGLSIGTISNTLRNNGNVKEKNRKKIFEVMERLNYRLDYQASSLGATKKNLIGLIIGSTENIAETQILLPLETFAESQHSRVISATSRSDSERERKNCESMLSSKVDVLFVFIQSLENEKYFRNLAETEKTPIIFLSRHLDNFDFPYVAVDNVYAAQEMVKYVYDLGHRDITYLDIASESMLSPNRDRRNGVELECERRGIDFKILKFQAGDNDIDVGFRAGEELIKGGTLPSLVFPRDDSFAVGFYNACLSHGVNVPEDVSIMSFGNFYPEHITTKPLSTYERNFNEVVMAATNLYLQIDQGELLHKNDKEIFIKGSVIPGETVKNLLL